MANIILFRGKNTRCKSIGNQDSAPPWGLLYISAYLNHEGYTIKIIDEAKEQNWRAIVKEEITKDTICVGVSSMTGYQIHSGLVFSKFIKAISDLPVVWGGVHPTILPHQTLSNNFVDIVVIGDGERPFYNIVKALSEKKSLVDISGIGYKKGSRIIIDQRQDYINMDALPEIPLNLINVEDYIIDNSNFIKGSKRAFELHTGRGCSHKCLFCYNYGRFWRGHSANRIMEEVEKNIAKYNIDSFHWREDNFFHNKNRVYDICSMLIDKNINIKWSSSCRIDDFNSFNDDFILNMKKSGLSTLVFGAESGSENILKLINKNIVPEQVLEVNKRIKNFGIDCYYNFMFGLPFENKPDVRLTFRLVEKILKDNPNANFFLNQIYAPYPGTGLYEVALRKGFKAPGLLEKWSAINWSYLKDYSQYPWLNNGVGDFIRKKRYILKIISLTRNGTLEKSFQFKLKLIKYGILPLPTLKFLYRKFIGVINKAVKGFRSKD